MSSVMNMEFVHALNPLYAFPIVAVILCAFVVFAFGFKSPVQPPSFDAIEEEKKSSKKRKTKETNKVKVIQNGKLNGSTVNKNQVSISTKKKEVEKSVSANKSSLDKSLNEKKISKKSKSSNEKKVSQEKKKDNLPLEDPSEGGWVQLVSKKGRKNRKKDEVMNVESQVCITKPDQNLQNKSDEVTFSEETLMADIVENSTSEKKLVLENEENEFTPVIENFKEKIVIIEDCKSVDINSIQKPECNENVSKSEKLNDEINIKSKKKKKKTPEINTNNIESLKLSSEQAIPEIFAPPNSTNFTPIATEICETINDKVEENHSKETKTSNVVFDELAGLYPEPKEQRKKKRVRRDH